ncbi:acetyltransferase [Halogeometricum borinquense DSM 11551]|uniref:Acetyltransferase n=1 Tax=Halogeometricum borinquense (strain ATCC 700274 / DSM 11551 / JCM 10706 / KCTC 4070 / PR3) TaxID=469382 RepID=E4NKZ5_HALBP|nr:GNAT family N-acetyltransferase [Halogeometricum borinquense]ADQ67147.1 acetyltransferase [Halogeometricum borinquense DSM 11551]ELY29695.1 acetyltransferase [Halogeometricum borinquense DSM 11551]
MKLRHLPANESAVRRYVEELWLPYHRELEATVETHALADDVDIVTEEVAFRLDWLNREGHRVWVAFDESNTTDANETVNDHVPDADTGAFSDPETVPVGFVTTECSEAPSVFDRTDRLCVGDIFVCEPYRGTGLANELVRRAAEDARERGCSELALDVDVDNGRAVAFYESLGFETTRRQMVADVAES